MSVLENRSFVTGYFGLDLDGLDCGVLQKIEGGDAEGTVTTIPIAHDYFVMKTISQFKYKDFTVQVGLSMAKPLLEWIESSLNMDYQRKNGAIKAADFTRTVRFIREFREALITEIGFPACDAASKDPSYLTLKFAPEHARNKKGDGTIVEATTDFRQKVFLPSNFRVSIDGLEQSTSKISKVEAITIKQTKVDDDFGESEGTIEPGHIEFPNLKITVSDAFAQPLYDWFEDFVVAGHCDASKERTGSLIYLDQTTTKSLVELSFANLGICAVRSNAESNNKDEIATVTADFYCEKISAKFL